MQVGRVDLYLLDCDVDGNKPEDRELTSRLYGGDHRTRVRQVIDLRRWRREGAGAGDLSGCLSSE